VRADLIADRPERLDHLPHLQAVGGEVAPEVLDLDPAVKALDHAVVWGDCRRVRTCVSSGRESMKRWNTWPLKHEPLSLKTITGVTSPVSGSARSHDKVGENASVRDSRGSGMRLRTNSRVKSRSALWQTEIPEPREL
jgi:hypothetical protein